MQFAMFQGERVEAHPGLKGHCPLCMNATLAKCGEKILWHWAHRGRRHCDPWWENETDWHRAWKSRFPAAWREVVNFDAITGEKHIADVKTDTGVVVEFQNSAMSADELRSREAFYGKMIWIVNGLPFIGQFHVLERLPSPDWSGNDDIRFFPNRRHFTRRQLMFMRPSDDPNRKPGDLVRIHGGHEIEDAVRRTYWGHHLYDWVRPRSVWYDATRPVFLDFGGDGFWHLQDYSNYGLQCVQLVAKAKVVREHGGVFDTFDDFVFPPGPNRAEPTVRAVEPVDLLRDDDLPF